MTLAGPLAGALECWRTVAKRFELDALATSAGALLLEAELDDAARARLLGELADRIAPRRRDVIAALAPLAGAAEATAAVTALEARGLVTTFRQYAGPWVLAELTLDPKVRELCLAGAPHGQAGAAPGARVTAPTSPALQQIPRIERQIRDIVRRCRSGPERFLLVIRGRPGSGRDTALAALLESLGVAALDRSVSELRQSADPLEPELSGRAAVWDARRWDPTPDDYAQARRWLRRSRSVCVALLDRHQDAPDVDGRLALHLDLDARTREDTHATWRLALRASPAPRKLIAAAARTLGDRNWAGVGLAARAARLLAVRRARTADELAAEVEGLLALSVQPSMLRGVLVEQPEVSLSQVIAPAPVVRALEMLVALCETHARVGTSGRSGVKALLSGPSGTGKTMAAQAVARALRRTLHRVDLAQVVSRWVGETEKNLRDVLAASEALGAVLLFDEGDSLFSRRGEVEKGTDRYANMEVSYLLQAIEAFAGVAIVTTNQRQNIDPAFERRFDMFIELTSPGRQERELIWGQELGPAAAALPSEHLGQLARRAELNGGSIAAAARLARVLAHRRGPGGNVTADDLRVAVQGEFLKTGMPVQAAQWSNELDLGRGRA